MSYKKPKENIITFRGRKYHYHIRFPETVIGRKDAKEYSKNLAIRAKAFTLVKEIPGIGFCVYISK